MNMKKQIHPAVAGILIVLALVGIGLIVIRKSGGFGPEELTPQQNPMPASAAKTMREMQEKLKQQRQKAQATSP